MAADIIVIFDWDGISQAWRIAVLISIGVIGSIGTAGKKGGHGHGAERDC